MSNAVKQMAEQLQERQAGRLLKVYTYLEQIESCSSSAEARKLAKQAKEELEMYGQILNKESM